MNNEDIIITEVRTSEVEQLLTISIKTFEETFASQNSKANMTRYITENMTTQKLVKEISAMFSKFYFAFYKEELAGYLKINFPDQSSDN